MTAHFPCRLGLLIALTLGIALPLAAQTLQVDLSADDSLTLRCESIGHEYRHCKTDTRRGVQLVHQYSSSPCVLGRSWGHDRRGIWVNKGCRAEFAVGDYGNRVGSWNDSDYYPGSRTDLYGPTPQKQPSYCGSEDNRPYRCNAPVRRDVRMVRQVSKATCAKGRTWGWDRDGIWVDYGCRAYFLVD